MTAPELHPTKSGIRGRKRDVYGLDAPSAQQDHKVLAVWGDLLPEDALPFHSRRQRQERMAEALATDRVLTREQLIRYFHADAEDLSVFSSATYQIEPVHMRSTVVSTAFYGLKPDDVKRRPASVAHDVGTAQIRLHLEVDTAQWKTVQRTNDIETIKPDAVMTTDAGLRVAVEYDRGSYTRTKVIRKLIAFSQKYAATVWAVPPPVINMTGVPSKRSRQAALYRMAALAPELARTKSPIYIISVEWWRDAQVIRR